MVVQKMTAARKKLFYLNAHQEKSFPFDFLFAVEWWKNQIFVAKNHSSIFGTRPEIIENYEQAGSRLLLLQKRWINRIGPHTKKNLLAHK